MNKILGALVVLLAGLVLHSSCNDPGSIGSELLNQDQVAVSFTDTISLKTQTIVRDSLQTYGAGTNIISSFSCGNFDDPTFGNVTAEIFTQLRLSGAPPNFVDADVTLDSVILFLVYDSTGVYGDLTQTQSLEVHRLTEDMDNTQDYYATDSFEADETEKLGELLDFVVRPTQEEFIYNNAGAKIDSGAILKINLNEDFGNELLGLDSAAYANSENFVDIFKGIRIRAAGGNSNLMMNFRFTAEFPKLSLYYKIDTSAYVYDIGITSASARTVHVEQSISSTVQTAIDNESTDLAYMQGLTGSDIMVTFPNASDFGDVIINKAELELTILQEMAPNNEFYPPASQIIAAEPGNGDNANDLLLIKDVVFAVNVGQVTNFFGGIVEEEEVNGNLLQKYRLNISGHFQEIIDGEVSDTLFLRLSPKQDRVARTIIYGSSDPQFPAKLNVAFTKPNN